MVSTLGGDPKTVPSDRSSCSINVATTQSLVLVKVSPFLVAYV